MKGYIVFLISGLVLGLSIHWMSVPTFPSTLEHNSDTYVKEAITRLAYRIGVFLDSIGIPASEKMLRFVYQVGGVLFGSSMKFHLDIERTTISDISVIIFTPQHSSGALPVVLYFHGGGWVFASPEVYFPFTAWLAQNAGVKVISLDYGLSPETTYEKQIDGCVNVAMNVIVNHDTFDIDPNRVFLAGDSAGGNLAAGVSLALSRVKQRVQGNLLLSPAVQLANFTLPSFSGYRHLFHSPPEFYTAKRAGFKLTPGLSYAINRGLHISSQTLNEWNRDYLNVSEIPDYVPPSKKWALDTVVPIADYSNDAEALKEIGKMAQDPLAYPLIASDDELKEFPPTFVQACEFDFLRDEELLFAHRLQKLNVEVTLSYLHNATHVEPVNAFFHPLPMSASAQKGLGDMVSFITTHK